MKNLSKVTRDDAVAMLEAGGHNPGAARYWRTTVQKVSPGVGHLQLYRRSWALSFHFIDDEGITIMDDQDKDGFASPAAHVKAHQLGYHVPGLSEHMKE